MLSEKIDFQHFARAGGAGNAGLGVATVSGLRIATPFTVSASSANDSHEDLLHQIAEISAMCEQIERAVQSLIERYGENSEAARSAKTLGATAAALKPQLLEYYLECRIGEAARAVEAIRN